MSTTHLHVPLMRAGVMQHCRPPARYARCRLRAPRHQARQHNVSAADQALDAHRLFGCAARTGSRAGTGFSLFYAAPEVLQAYLGNQTGVVAAEAMDAWSLGVLAIELFIGKPAFDRMQPKAQVHQKRRGYYSTCPAKFYIFCGHLDIFDV